MRLLPAVFMLTALPAFAEPPKVVTDIAPIHSLVLQVMEGIGEPVLLLDQGADPHRVTLRPGQARALDQADLIVWVGGAFEPWLQDAVTKLSPEASYELLKTPNTDLLAQIKVDEDDDHHDEHKDEDDDHGDAHDDDAHDHGDIDPHAWLSPVNGGIWMGDIADKLAELDPANAEKYRANADAALLRLSEVEVEIDGLLRPLDGASIITFHNAYRYFADRFGLKIAGSLRPSDASPSTAAALARLSEKVETTSVPCAFSEPGFDERILLALSAEVPMRLGVLDPTGSLVPLGPDHYATTLLNMANTIAACLNQQD